MSVGVALDRHGNAAVTIPRSGYRTLARPVESLLLLLVAVTAYALLGANVVTSNHVVVFDALDRLTRAYMVWHNSPRSWPPSVSPSRP